MGLDAFFHRYSYTGFTEKEESGALQCLFHQSFQKAPLSSMPEGWQAGESEPVYSVFPSS